MLGANPYASNGSLCTAPDLPGPARGDPGARRHGRGGRPAPQPHRRGGRRARRHPARHRRPPAARASSTCCSPSELVDLGRRRRARRAASTSVARLVAAVHARGGRAHRAGIDADDHPAARPRARRRADAPRSTAASAPAPSSSARSRRGWSTCSTCSPATSTGPAARCSPLGRATSAPPQRRAGPRVQHRPPRTAGCKGYPEVLGELPVATPGRGDRDAGRGPDPGADHHRRQPGAVARPNGDRLDAALRVARVHGQRRHLPQRDDAARRRDPAGAVAARAAATTTSRSTAGRAQRRRTTRRRSFEPDAARRVRDPRPPGADRCSGQGADADPAVDRRRAARPACCSEAIADADSPDRRSRPPRSSRRAARPRARLDQLLDAMLRTGAYGDGFGAEPDGLSLASARGQPARRRPRPAAAPRCPSVLQHADAARSSWRPSSSSPTSPAARGGARPPVATATSCSSAAATCARTTRGCTTSRCW